MNDPINREDAINAIYHHFPQMTMRECAEVLHEVPPAEVTLCHLGSPCEYQNADIAMPSAPPERCEDCVNFSKARLLIPQSEMKVGKWETEIRTIHGAKIPFYACSECGKNSADEYRYCPNCGARMEGEEE